MNKFIKLNYSIFKPLIFILAMLTLQSCYNAKTHGKFITEHYDAWIDGYAIRMSEHEEADKGLLFCRANIDDDGKARPTCYKAKFKE